MPTPAEIEKAAKAIRSQVRHLFGTEVAKTIRVLYGGSVNPDNAAAFVNATGIVGLLVGGASLDAHSFAAIVEKSHNPMTNSTKGKTK